MASETSSQISRVTHDWTFGQAFESRKHSTKLTGPSNVSTTSYKQISEGGLANEYPPLDQRIDFTKPAARSGLMTCSRYFRDMSSFLAISFNSIGPSP